MTKIEECYGNYFDFLFFLRFAHTDMILVVDNDNNLKANCPADVCGVGGFKSRFLLWFWACCYPDLFLLREEYRLGILPLREEEQGQ